MQVPPKLQKRRNLDYNCRYMQEAMERFSKTLRKQGYHVTVCRQAVFIALQDHQPQTMAEIASRAGTNADRASVYRAIRLFERLGIVQRLQIGWKYKLELSDAFSPHHHHISCTMCGTVMTLPEDSSLERRIKQLALASGFQPTDHQVEVRGLCPTCQKVEIKT